jgi:hypothetical protein
MAKPFRSVLFIFLTILIFASLLTSSLTHPNPVLSQPEITLLDDSTVIQFPLLMAFNLAVQSSSEITKIRLNYVIDKMNYADIISETEPQFTPSTKVQATWIWDMRKSSLPPMAKLEYWWLIENKNGNRLVTKAQQVSFNDSNHTWTKVSSAKISLFWYQGNDIFANQLLSSAVDALIRLTKDTGASLDRPVEIYIYNGSADLQKAMVSPREWTGGVAYAEFGIIAIGVSPDILTWGKTAVAHELGHMVTHQLTFSPYSNNLPTWLDEGLAKYAENAPDLEMQSRLKKAITENNYISLHSLSDPFSAITDEALLSYAESKSVVAFLINKYGINKILALLELFKAGNTVDDSLNKIYGFNLDGLESSWLGELKTTSKTSRVKPFLFDTTLSTIKYLLQRIAQLDTYPISINMLGIK